YDTPYRDAAKGETSRQTVIIYLTAGRNEEGVIRIEKERIHEVEAGQILIFPHFRCHSGLPFKSGGKKIFIRSELIYDDTVNIVSSSSSNSFSSSACSSSSSSHFSTSSSALSAPLSASTSAGQCVDYDPTVSKTFNIACYMAQQSLFNSELSSYSS